MAKLFEFCKHSLWLTVTGWVGSYHDTSSLSYYHNNPPLWPRSPVTTGTTAKLIYFVRIKYKIINCIISQTKTILCTDTAFSCNLYINQPIHARGWEFTQVYPAGFLLESSSKPSLATRSDQTSPLAPRIVGYNLPNGGNRNKTESGLRQLSIVILLISVLLIIAKEIIVLISICWCNNSLYCELI